MRLLQGTNYFEDHGGGVEIVAGNLGRALAQNSDVVVNWMAAGPVGEIDFPGTLTPLPTSNLTEDRLGFPLPLPGLSALKKIKKAVESADILLLHDALYPTNIAAARYARKLNRPVVFTQHVGEVPYTNPVLRLMMKTANKFIAQPVLAKADQVVFISGIAQKHFEATVRFEPEALRIYNGIREDLGPARIREQRGPTNILFVGRFVEKKGMEVLRRIIPNCPDTNWVFCGRGDVNPIDWGFSNLRMAGHLSAEALAVEYDKADLLVLPSVGEGLPLVVQEALALGLPVLSSDELLVADPWLEHQMSTAPVDMSDVTRTAKVWSDIISSALHIKKPDPDAVRARYNWASAATSYKSIFDNLVH